jgi:hypothetical protein
MKKKLLLGLGLLSVPFMAYAEGKVQFNLLNTSPSLAYPTVQVEQGLLSYFYISYGGTPVPAGCPVSNHRAFVQLSDLTPVPFSVSKVTPSTFTFTPPDLSACMVGQDIYAIVTLHITKVNEIYGKACSVQPGMTSVHDIVKTNIDITRTSDTFYCH